MSRTTACSGSEIRARRASSSSGEDAHDWQPVYTVGGIIPQFSVVTAYDADAFDAYEASGWEAVAAEYEEHWSSITRRVIDPLLDAAGVARGARLVDVGAGAGDAAGRAAERGAIAVGVDVAAAMVEIAALRHPAARFFQASATRLPFADGSFDAAVGNIVIQHIGEPERAALELARVLVSDGRVALSTWDAPERSPFFATILGAVADAEAPPPTGIPAGPLFFQFADDVVFAALCCAMRVSRRSKSLRSRSRCRSARLRI